MFSIDFANLNDAAFEKLKMEAEKDVRLSKEDLSSASYDTPKIYMKYLNLHLDAGRQLKCMLSLEKKMYRQVWEYYSGKSPAELYVKKPLPIKILKTDLETYIETDSSMISIRQKTDDVKKVVLYLEKVLDQIKSRGFIIKNMIDYEKFKNGGF